MVTVEIYDVVSRVKIYEFHITKFIPEYPGKKRLERDCLRCYERTRRPGFKCYARCKF